MRSILLTGFLMVGSLGMWVGSPSDALAQSAAGTPEYAQPHTTRGDWTHYYYGPPYYNWRGQEQWNRHHWQWSEGRSFYPGYRYYSYPQYGTYFNGGGYHYFAPGYYYPHQ
jgi:hypothetical protein